MNSFRCFILALGCLFPSALWADSKDVDFAREILPILSNKCFACHGPDGEAKDTLRLDSFEAVTTELESGNKGIDPNNLGESAILSRIHSATDPMPPADAGKQLTDAERELLTRWVKGGGSYATHWAFVPPTKPSPPKIAELANPIDAFVAKQLQEKDLDFAPAADPATLARRVALVLTGLPPEPTQLANFLADKKPGSYERLVDDLLASPRFGEHQARYWLDAVRYGDTHGLHLDNRRAIYPYRDWVIHALNENLPFDQFIEWQLAGDLLPNPTLQQLAATGFVRMNPTTAEGGVIAAEFQAKNNFDRVETFGTVFLGMTLTCARCHTHKYDPVLHSEYYELFAFFNSTAESPLDGNRYEYGPVMKLPQSVSAWEEWTHLEAEANKLFAKADAALKLLPDADQKKWLSTNTKKRLEWLAKSDGSVADAEMKAKCESLLVKMNEAEKSFASSLVAAELPKPRETKILNRGEYDLPTGEPLQPGTLAILGELPKDAPNNRLGLARWLTSKEHPLTSRVLINRVWQRTFGDGLVRTPEDFGVQGEQPTHPELLDWLAVEFQDRNWDLKAMLRLMVTSRTFQQSSAWRKDMSDPENRLLARGPRFRLDAEVLRDVALWSSNLLATEKGGEGIKPYQPAGLWSALMHPASNTKKYVQDKGDRLYRRSLYVYWKRTSPHPMLTLFDAPSRESSCVRRSRSNTPLQSLGLLNETQRVEMGRKLAERLLTEADSDEGRLNLLFTLLSCRQPTDKESDACRKLLKTMRNRYTATPADAKTLLTIGEAPNDDTLDPIDQAAWAQLAITLLASDIAIMVY